MNRKLAAELDRRAAAQNTTRARLIEDMIWSVVFPDEPTPSAERARKDAERQTKKTDSAARKQNARWEKKMAAAKVKWHQKFDGEIIKTNLTINDQKIELYGTRAELATDVKEIMSEIIREVHEENQKKTV